jgi:hypothetical protein
MKPTTLLTLLCGLLAGTAASAQTPMMAKHRICMDVAHQQRFWHDPADMPGKDKLIERVKDMTGEFLKTAASVDAILSYLKKEVNPKTSKDATCCSSSESLFETGRFVRRSSIPVASRPDVCSAIRLA